MQSRLRASCASSLAYRNLNGRRWKSGSTHFRIFRTWPSEISRSRRAKNSGAEQGLLYWELLDLAYIQSHLAEDGILIRGATTVGDIYVDERLIFGPALIRAYELERDVASYPRIILDSRVFDRLSDTPELCMPAVADQMKSLRTVLARDNDGTWFVDYLQATMHELASQPAAYGKFLRKHRDVVRRAAAKLTELCSPAAKVGWLVSYHNHTVSASRLDVLEKNGIDAQDLMV